MAKYKKKYATGGNVSYNGNPVSDGSKDKPVDPNQQSNNFGQYAGYGMAALNAASAYQQAQNNPNLSSAQKTNQGVNGGIDAAAGTALPWYGLANSASGIGKSFIKKDEYGNAANQTGQAANEIITPDHKHMINDISNKNYTALAFDAMGLGKFGRMASELSGNADKTTGFWGKANKALGTLQTEKGNVVQQDKLMEEQAIQQQQAQQAQQDYINQQVQASLAASQGSSQMGWGGIMNHNKKMCADGGSITQYSGPSHNEGGIPIGQQIEVEGKETRGIPDTETEDYIFSERLKIPGKKISFAKASKIIEAKFSKRDNDKMSDEQKRNELNKLMNDQEGLRSKMMTSAYKRAFGGQLDVNSFGDAQTSNTTGTTNSYPLYQNINGQPVKGYAKVTPSAYNAIDRSGKNMIPLQGAVPVSQAELNAQLGTANYAGNYTGNSNLNISGANDFRMTSDKAGNNYYWKGNTPITEAEYKPKFATGGKIQSYDQELANINNQYSGGQYDVQNRNTNSGVNNIDYNNLYSLGNVLGAGYDIYRGAKGAAPVNYERINPDLVNYGASRDLLRKDINAGYENTRGNIRSVVNNPAQYLNLVTQVAANRDQQIADSITKSQEAEANANAGIKNQSKYANAQIQKAEADARQMERDQAANTLSTGLYNAGSAIAQQGRDKKSYISQAEAKKLIGTADYSYEYDKSGKIKGIRYSKTGEVTPIK